MNEIASPERAITKRRTWFWVWRFVVLAVICGLITTLFIRALVLDVYRIESISMQSTLNPGQSVMVDRRAYADADPQRGDVIVFDGRGSFLPYARASFADDLLGALRLSGTENTYIKRVIAVGGDSVDCCGSDGKLSINGAPTDEPYIYAGNAASEQDFSGVVPEGRLWVMGDHRSRSEDSRALLGSSGGGMISIDRVVGKATQIVWPLDQRTGIE
ncbi:signal peptidase I [Glutamicibacter sp. 287]|uniref:signal peptidase I n=1 Tax=unclassified Glutamicibacter TaxID=2627139 RepID=UPI000BB90F8A|nr:signal peptidase I [Glutamicibacter sp. BW80]PCC27808.1 signal peptidase I [Glutamicibacter sp. BW80]